MKYIFKQKTIVVDLGGSIVHPQEIDVEYIRSFAAFIRAEIKNGRRFLIVIGGGKLARIFIGAAEQIAPITDEENNQNIELEPEVLGVKIDSSSIEQLDKIAVEANDIVGGQVSDFVTAGTLSTAKLGTGERAGVLNSYKSCFGELPRTQAEWEDIIRISINQLPLITNSAAEEKAKMEFKKVYQREADINNSHDQTAVNMIAYGLRPEKRGLDSERAGIGVFVRVYKYLPVSALDWDTVRAIAYSGVGR